MRHIVICGQSGSVFFTHYLMNGTILGKTLLLNTQCVFLFSLQHLSEIFLILRRIQRYMILCVCVYVRARGRACVRVCVSLSSCKVLIILVRF